MFIILLVLLSTAKAPCKHVVELAQAKVRANPQQASVCLREFSGIRLNDAEAGCHRVFKKYKLVPDIPIHHATHVTNAGGRVKLPYVKFSSWMKYLLDTDRLHRQMVGVRSFDTMRRVLKEYWLRYRQINPSYYLFEMADRGDVCLEFCIPFYSHSDEGRSYKHLGLWILSAAGVLGRGTSLYVSSGAHKKPLDENEMGMNYIGKTWATQFMFTSLLKTVYSKSPGTQDKMIQLFAQDAVDLLYTGITSKDGLKTIRMIHVGHKGDLPALSRMGHFERSFAHVPRAARSRKSCDGICFLCLAGVEAGGRHDVSFPFEDMSYQARWVETHLLHEPWQDLPDILVGLPLSTRDRINFFQPDPWHNYHLGVSKHFIASAWVSILESGLAVIPAGSVDARFQYITSLYLSFFRRKNHTPYINEISRESMGFPQGSATPVARWSKGVASTEMMAFLDSFCQQHITNKSDDPLLNSIVPQPQENLYWLFLFLMFVCILFTCFFVC